MAIGAFIPLVLFIVILGSVGVRLALLWRQTRELPELCLGSGLLIVSLSMPFSAVGRLPATAMEPIGRVCFATGMFAVAVGLSLIVFFNHLVFRRRSAWARVFFFVLSGLLFAAVAYMALANFQGASVDAIKKTMRPGTLVVMGTIMASFMWGGAESFRCHAAQRRQMALGLGSPVVANRFWLWGIASVTCSFLLLVLTVCVMTGMTILREPVPLMAIAAAGTVMSASWYLTFFAPERYRGFIRERSAAR